MAEKPALIKILHLISKSLPGDYLKTTFYLNFIAKPRKAIRSCLDSFYRIDHIYDVLMEFKNTYKGNFSILEFGTANGYAFTKMLYATRYLRMDERVVVHTFDSFEGMPAPVDLKDRGLIPNHEWVEGDFRANYRELDEYCRNHYKNYEIHKGYFHETLTDEFLNSLRAYLPILVWFDCDYYSSAKVVFERLAPYLPNGCVIYFDDYDFNFGSRFTGEARLVHEVNKGAFGDTYELVLDRNLSMNSNRIYRFINFGSNVQYEPISTARNSLWRALQRTNDSPLPCVLFWPYYYADLTQYQGFEKIQEALTYLI